MLGLDKEERIHMPRWEKDYNLQVNSKKLSILLVKHIL
jgi:hypothetical protein